jgi:hypothetical protein
MKVHTISATGEYQPQDLPSIADHHTPPASLRDVECAPYDVCEGTKETTATAYAQTTIRQNSLSFFVEGMYQCRLVNHYLS